MKKIVFLLILASLLPGKVESQSSDSAAILGSRFSPIKLTEQDSRYALASRSHSSGFFKAYEALNDTVDIHSLPLEFSGLNTDFKTHHRYWIYTKLINKTNNDNWMLHISAFGNLPPRALLISEQSREIKEFDYQNIDINMIGRATALKLQHDKPYFLLVEVKAEHIGLIPYIGLMSEAHYGIWTAQMDWPYKMIIGMIVLIILIAFICWLILKDNIFFWAFLSSLSLLLYYGSRSSIPATLWQSSYEKDWTLWTLTSFMLFTLTAFAASFLQVSKRDQKLYRIFYWSVLFTLFVFLCGFFLPFKSVAILYSANYFVVWLAILSSGLYKLSTEGRYYVIYILGWLPIVASFIHLFVMLLLPESKWDEVKANYRLIEVQAANLLHLIIHAVALVLRFKSLREQKQEAELTAKNKSLFIVQSAHDFRQPLSAMDIFIKYLEPYVQTKQGKALLNKLASTNQQLKESFTEIMDVSKLEKGVIKPKFEYLPIADIFCKIEEELSLSAQEKNLQLSFQSSQAFVFSDNYNLERIIKNLVSNAIKYTNSGRVVVGVRRRGLIQIWDTGPGIPEDKQDEIFDIYKKVDGSLSADGSSYADGSSGADGSGVGLSIAKQLADLLGHSIHIQSTSGKGSCFSISVPLLWGDSYRKPDEQTDSIKIVITLICESIGLSAYVQKCLANMHYTVRVFSSIEAAISEGFGSFAEQVDVVLCEDSVLDNSVNSFPEERDVFSKLGVSACVGQCKRPLPSYWLNVASRISPMQMRALINLAIRKQTLE